MAVHGLMRWCERHAGKVKESGGYNHVVIWDWFKKIYGYGLQGSSWCGATVCVANTWGAGWEPPANWTGVYYIEQWGRQHGRYHSGTSGIRRGDVLILIGHNVHTGIARGRPRLGYVPTYEGNTSSGASGSQNNGDGFYKRKRIYSQVVGYVRLHDLLDQHPSPKHPGDFHLTKTLVVDGDRGPQTVAHIQNVVGDIVDGHWCEDTVKHLKHHLNNKLGLTGKRALNEKSGRWTRRATRALQRYVGHAETGHWGSSTTKAVQRKLNAGRF